MEKKQSQLGFVLVLLGCIIAIQLSTGGIASASSIHHASNRPQGGYLSSLNVLSPFYWFSSGQQRSTGSETGPANSHTSRSSSPETTTIVVDPSDSTRVELKELAQPPSWSLINPLSWFAHGWFSSSRRSDDIPGGAGLDVDRAPTLATTAAPSSTPSIQLLEPVKLTRKSSATTTASSLIERQPSTSLPSSTMPSSSTPRSSSSIANMFTTTKRPRIVTEGNQGNNKINVRINHNGRQYRTQVDPANLRQSKSYKSANYSSAFDATNMNLAYNAEFNKIDI